LDKKAKHSNTISFNRDSNEHSLKAKRTPQFGDLPVHIKEENSEDNIHNRMFIGDGTDNKPTLEIVKHNTSKKEKLKMEKPPSVSEVSPHLINAKDPIIDNSSPQSRQKWAEDDMLIIHEELHEEENLKDDDRFNDELPFEHISFPRVPILFPQTKRYLDARILY